jgi:hypothetical protein
MEITVNEPGVSMAYSLNSQEKVTRPIQKRLGLSGSRLFSSWCLLLQNQNGYWAARIIIVFGDSNCFEREPHI